MNLMIIKKTQKNYKKYKIKHFGLDYTYFQNVELDCTTGQPLNLPTPNAKYIGCE
jgi:hypothetical protein